MAVSRLTMSDRAIPLDLMVFKPSCVKLTQLTQMAMTHLLVGERSVHTFFILGMGNILREKQEKG